MSRTRYEMAILGGGPVGMIAALCSAQRSPTVLILRPQIKHSAVPRIETVPAPMLSFLIDYGVHPRRIGVERLYENRHMAWESADPRAHRGRAMAHINKAALQSELLSIAKHAANLDIVVDRRAPSRGQSGQSHWLGSNWTARHLIDATGRAAATATRRVMARKPWVARPFWSTAPAPMQRREFAIAALPFGYAYRISSDTIDSLWIAGRGATLSASPNMIEAQLKSAAAGWLLEGLPGLGCLHAGRAFPVSVQWAEGSTAIAVGDAALAQDVLSSQGIAAGLSTACFGVAAESANDTGPLVQRQLAERTSHLRSLSTFIASCRYADSGEWQRYQDFIGMHLREEASHSRCFLSEKRSMQLSLEQEGGKCRDGKLNRDLAVS
jgi:2-polyprenyl-6-methoxyphenol hydroxylase-like FAD-dependent oxidoreductase